MPPADIKEGSQTQKTAFLETTCLLTAFKHCNALPSHFLDIFTSLWFNPTFLANNFTFKMYEAEHQHPAKFDNFRAGWQMNNLSLIATKSHKLNNITNKLKLKISFQQFENCNT